MFFLGDLTFSCSLFCGTTVVVIKSRAEPFKFFVKAPRIAQGFPLFPNRQTHLASRRPWRRLFFRIYLILRAVSLLQGSPSPPQGNMHPIRRADGSLTISLNPLFLCSGPPRQQPPPPPPTTPRTRVLLPGAAAPVWEEATSSARRLWAPSKRGSMKLVPGFLPLVGSSFVLFFFCLSL